MLCYELIKGREMLQNLHDMFLSNQDGSNFGEDLSTITLARSPSGMPEYVKESSFGIRDGEGVPFMSPQHIRNCLEFIRGELYLLPSPRSGLVGDEKIAYDCHRRAEEIRLRKKRKDFDEEVLDVLLDHIRIFEELCTELEHGNGQIPEDVREVAKVNYLRKWEIYVE